VLNVRTEVDPLPRLEERDIGNGVNG